MLQPDDNMQKLPEISVILPVFNAEKFIVSTIDSILNQSFTDFELIIVDDGSTDESSKICDDYAIKELELCTKKILELVRLEIKD